MISFLYWYLSVGIALYLVAAVANFRSFKNADTISIFRGILGIFLWPVVVYFWAKDL